VQIFEYPASAVMKLWHLLLTALGVDEVTAWVFTVPLLVVTVRSFLLPFAYRSMASTRRLVNLRPALNALEDEYTDRLGPEANREKMQRRRQLQQDGGYRMRDGCLPAFIQIPFFIGLYRILLLVSRPDDLEASTHPGRGALNSDDVDTFLQARIFDIPLPAYSVMTDEQFTFLGTSAEAVFRIALPLCIAAAVFTTVNLSYSIRRNWMTLDVTSGLARSMFKMMFGILAFAMIFPLAFGLGGPAPVAIMCYWVMNNLWTAVQNIGFHLYLDRKIPYSEEFVDHRNATRDRRRERKQELRDAKAGFAAREKDRTVRRRALEQRTGDAASLSPQEHADALAELEKEAAQDRARTNAVVNREKIAKQEKKERTRRAYLEARLRKQQAQAAARQPSGESADVPADSPAEDAGGQEPSGDTGDTGDTGTTGTEESSGDADSSGRHRLTDD
jgi:YidC/Oxa1 family membrane protein insertase